MLPDLHRRNDKPDWEYVNENQRNSWQRLAASTNGLVTPGNFITVLGFLLVIAGLVLIVHKSYIGGLMAIVLGRLGDVLDGIAATRTGTKSATGELLDLTVDKLIVFIALAVLFFYFDVVWFILALILVINALNGLSTVVAKLRGKAKHPSRAGKYAMALCWLIIVLAVLLTKTDNSALRGVTYAFTVAYAAVGGWASYNYLQQMFASK